MSCVFDVNELAFIIFFHLSLFIILFSFSVPLLYLEVQGVINNPETKERFIRKQVEGWKLNRNHLYIEL